MQPWQLLVLVAAILIVRVVVTLLPVTAGGTDRARHFAHEYLDPFIVAGLAAWILITFVARTYYIPSGSMIPTLAIHDVLLVNKFEYRFRAPRQGDIVVFRPPTDSGGDDDFIKRVIGTPGDRLRISGGIVYRNGKPLSEPYIADKPSYSLEVKNYGIYVDSGDGTMRPLETSEANIPPKSQWTAPNRIPPNFYFMMGDNRNESDDSHIWGFAQPGGTFASGPRAKQHAGFTGHAFVLFWPLNHARFLSNP
jgi:signal peptidase I